ncbi:MAG TPA: hypothetical protein VIW67_16490, partial [Terriglobales bacterium]
QDHARLRHNAQRKNGFYPQCLDGSGAKKTPGRLSHIAWERPTEVALMFIHHRQAYPAFGKIWAYDPR